VVLVQLTLFAAFLELEFVDEIVSVLVADFRGLPLDQIHEIFLLEVDDPLDVDLQVDVEEGHPVQVVLESLQRLGGPAAFLHAPQFDAGQVLEGFHVFGQHFECGFVQVAEVDFLQLGAALEHAVDAVDPVLADVAVVEL